VKPAATAGLKMVQELSSNGLKLFLSEHLVLYPSLRQQSRQPGTLRERCTGLVAELIQQLGEHSVQHQAAELTFTS
jgi:hypothetical protein